MEWFNGTVDDALTEYQQKKGILIVYVYAENGLFFNLVLLGLSPGH